MQPVLAVNAITCISFISITCCSGEIFATKPNPSTEIRLKWSWPKQDDSLGIIHSRLQMCFWEGKGWEKAWGEAEGHAGTLLPAAVPTTRSWMHFPAPHQKKPWGLNSTGGWAIPPCWSHPDTPRSPIIFAGNRDRGSPVLTCAMDNGWGIPHPRPIFCPFVAPSLPIHQRLSQSQSNAPYLNKDQALSFILNTAVQRRQKTEQTNSNPCKALSVPGTDWEIICHGDGFSSLSQPAVTPPSSNSLLDTWFAMPKACERPPEMALCCSAKTPRDSPARQRGASQKPHSCHWAAPRGERPCWAERELKGNMRTE